MSEIFMHLSFTKKYTLLKMPFFWGHLRGDNNYIYIYNIIYLCDIYLRLFFLCGSVKYNDTNTAQF